MVELLNERGGRYTLLIFHEKITPWVCLDGSGLKDILYLLALVLTLSRSFLTFVKYCEGNEQPKTLKYYLQRALH